MVSFNLDDGEALNRAHPDSFFIPSAEARHSLVAGALVKLIFRIEHDGSTDVERMWVIVKGVEDEGYVGELDNQPYCTSELVPGTEISFAARHVIQIYDKA